MCCSQAHSTALEPKLPPTTSISEQHRWLYWACGDGSISAVRSASILKVIPGCPYHRTSPRSEDFHPPRAATRQPHKILQGASRLFGIYRLQRPYTLQRTAFSEQRAEYFDCNSRTRTNFTSLQDLILMPPWDHRALALAPEEPRTAPVQAPFEKT